MSKKILIVGCGDLGIRTALELNQRGHSVTGARRAIDKIPDAIDKIALDVTRAESFQSITHTQWDAIIVSLTARGEAAYRQVYVEGVRHLLATLKTMHNEPMLLFVSSTSVYAQNDGSVVDETSPTEPTGYSGLTMLAAEALVAQSGLSATSVRFSGIYGATHTGQNTVNTAALRGGHLLSVLREGRIAPQAPVRYSNRIHIDDCVGILLFLLQRYFDQQPLSPIYLASDGKPANLHDVMRYLADMAGIATDTLTPDYLPGRGGNKRCIGKLLQEQGYQFRVPDYRKGYA